MCCPDTRDEESASAWPLRRANGRASYEQGWKAAEQVIKDIPGGGERQVVRYVLDLAREAERPVVCVQRRRAAR